MEISKTDKNWAHFWKYYSTLKIKFSKNKIIKVGLLVQMFEDFILSSPKYKVMVYHFLKLVYEHEVMGKGRKMINLLLS